MPALRQRATRYQTDKTTTAQVHYGPTPEIVRDLSIALICDVSKSGCKLVLVNPRTSNNGDLMFVSIGGGDFVRATLRWQRPIDTQVLIIGCEFFSQPRD